LSASATDGASILAERVVAMLADGFKGVNGVDVLETPGDYFINNYWAQTDVDQYGHIVDAYRIKEDLTIELDGFMHLDPSETVVTYCWTGQTSSMVTAYLTVLGFDSTSLKFGVNSLIYDELEGHQWTGSADYDYETG
jgi:rhodanese-related sulfurtransferase